MPATWQIARALWGLGLGTAFFVMIYMIFANGYWRAPAGQSIPELDPTPPPQGEVSDFPEGLQEAHGKVTPFLRWFVIVYVLWMIGYVALFLLWSSGTVYLPAITAAPYSTATQLSLIHI